VLRRVQAQLTDPMIILLIGAVAVTAGVGDVTDMVIILCRHRCEHDPGGRHCRLPAAMISAASAVSRRHSRSLTPYDCASERVAKHVPALERKDHPDPNDNLTER
jgi:hypothetical protein